MDPTVAAAIPSIDRQGQIRSETRPDKTKHKMKDLIAKPRYKKVVISEYSPSKVDFEKNRIDPGHRQRQPQIDIGPMNR